MLALWKTYEEREVEVKGHDHMTRNYWKSTHQECNLNLILSQKNLDLLRNLQNYDSHLIFQEIGKYNFKNVLNVIAKTIEKCMIFTIKQPKEKDIKAGL